MVLLDVFNVKTGEFKKKRYFRVNKPLPTENTDEPDHVIYMKEIGFVTEDKIHVEAFYINDGKFIYDKNMVIQFNDVEQDFYAQITKKEFTKQLKEHLKLIQKD